MTTIHFGEWRIRIPAVNWKSIPDEARPDGTSTLIAVGSLAVLAVTGVVLYVSWPVGIPVAVVLATTAVVLVHRVVAASEVVDTEPDALDRLLVESTVDAA